MDVPETEYAMSGDVHIAYQRFGRGPIDLVFVPGWASHIDLAWEDPIVRRFLERLGSFARVVWFDKRGTGLSDRVADLPILEVRVDDVRAVMDAVGLRQAAVMGISEGGSMSALFAATYPERTNALVLWRLRPAGLVRRLPLCPNPRAARGVDPVARRRVGSRQ